MVQRLDLRTVRYDRMSEAVLMDGKHNLVVAVTRDALEALYDRSFEPEEAVIKAVEEVRRLTVLADRIPADDGRIMITKDMLLSGGQYLTGQANGSLAERNGRD